MFLVHGEEEAKLTFAQLIKDKLGYEPIAVMGNSEYELQQGEKDLELLNVEKAEEAAETADEVRKVRNQITGIHNELEKILYNAQTALNKDITEEKLQEIRNIVQDLNKSCMDLASTVLEKKGE